MIDNEAEWLERWFYGLVCSIIDENPWDLRPQLSTGLLLIENVHSAYLDENGMLLVCF